MFNCSLTARNDCQDVNGEWREQMKNRKHYAQRLSNGVQNVNGE